MTYSGYNNCPPQQWNPENGGQSAADRAANRFSVSNKYAVVTGGASGLALDATISLLEHGLMGVVLVDINTEGLKEAQKSLKQLHPDGYIFIKGADVSDPTQVQQAVEFAYSKFNEINIVLAFAGVRASMSPTGRPEANGWRHVMDKNVNSVYYTCKMFGEAMIEHENRGSIIIASSSGGHGMYGVQNDHPLPLPIDYTTAKASLLALRFSFAFTMARFGIRVNSISPGWMETPMIAPLLQHKPFVDAWTNAIPMGRFGQRGETNGAILLLASDAGSYITGADIRIDGGLSSQA